MTASRKDYPFKTDYHIHTEFAYCAENNHTLAAAVARSSAVGLEQIAVTEHSEHLYFSVDDCRTGDIFSKEGGIDAARRSEFWRMPQYLEAVRKYRSSKVLLGMEVSADPNGKLYIHQDVLEELDIVIGAFQWVRDYSVEDLVGVTLKLLETGIDIIGHPFYLFAIHRAKVPASFYRELARASRDNNVAVELNSHHRKESAPYDEKLLPFLLEEGTKISLGSDSHRTEDIGNFSYQRGLFEKVGLTNQNEIEKHLFRFSAKRKRTWK